MIRSSSDALTGLVSRHRAALVRVLAGGVLVAAVVAVVGAQIATAAEPYRDPAYGVAMSTAIKDGSGRPISTATRSCDGGFGRCDRQRPQVGAPDGVDRDQARWCDLCNPL